MIEEFGVCDAPMGVNIKNRWLRDQLLRKTSIMKSCKTEIGGGNLIDREVAMSFLASLQISSEHILLDGNIEMELGRGIVRYTNPEKVLVDGDEIVVLFGEEPCDDVIVNACVCWSAMGGEKINVCIRCFSEARSNGPVLVFGEVMDNEGLRHDWVPFSNIEEGKLCCQGFASELLDVLGYFTHEGILTMNLNYIDIGKFANDFDHIDIEGHLTSLELRAFDVLDADGGGDYLAKLAGVMYTRKSHEPKSARKSHEPKSARKSHEPKSARKSHVLYRIYGNDNELLYIGISLRPLHRIQEHTKEKDWAKDIVRTDSQWLGDVTRREAEIVEKAAIIAETPLYNKTHNIKKAA